MSKTPFILFITGTSAAGKTTLYESLKADPELKDIRFHDIDEDGVPPVGRAPWRAFRVEKLLYEATLELKNGHSTIICGITKPHEVVESRYYSSSDNIHFLMVAVPFETLKARVIKRVEDQPKSGAFDEVFNPDAIEETLLGNKELLRVLKNSIAQQNKGHFIDVSSLTKSQMHDEVVSIIEQLN